MEGRSIACGNHRSVATYADSVEKTEERAKDETAHTNQVAPLKFLTIPEKAPIESHHSTRLNICWKKS